MGSSLHSWGRQAVERQRRYGLSWVSLEPSAGTDLIDGKDITHTPVEKRNIGMVFQSYALFPTMTVYENLAFWLEGEKKAFGGGDR